MKKKNSKIVDIIALVIIAIICVVIYITFSNLAENFTKDNPKGELFKVILTGIGGIGFIWGLWLNSRRIKEQNRQNNISENSNSDKRFIDAIGYLGSEKTSIVLGGIYALHQLAKEDERYRSIVANILTSYLRENSRSLYSELNKKFTDDLLIDSRNTTSPIQIQTIIDVLFNNYESVFENEYFDLSYILLENIIFRNPLKKCRFDYSEFTNCTFESKLQKCYSDKSTFVDCHFGNIFDGCIFTSLTFEKCSFFSTRKHNSVEKFNKSLFRHYISKNTIDEELAVIFEKCSFNNCSFNGFSIIKYYFTKVNFTSTTFRIREIISSSYSFGYIENLKFIDSKFTKTTIEENTELVYQNCVNKPDVEI